VLDDTIIVFTSDHGEGFATHHAGNLNHLVGLVYEQNGHIPLLVRIPGMRAGVENPRLGDHVDLAPTLFGLLGRSAPASWQGRDLLAERFESRPVLFMSRQKRRANGLVDGRYKYFFFDDKEEEHLYDLAEDPFEQRNLAGAMPDRAATYRETVRLWVLHNQQRYEAL
jgi:arylsulfatase A-like enzyme